ncbi:Ring type e3 ligase [Thalictrum thalictroides]|uniref:Ring type e3 ligase n=1 Tax=Thalictrum thalictroides TaxID=46969 RepID=A0A7J6XAP2_THATH|nr:Ring type e3 ligase [Thalictrum thalictroides]
MRSGNELQRHQDNIRDLQAQIFRLRLKISPSKMPALHWGTYGSHASCPSDGKNAQAITGIPQNLDFSKLNAVLQDNFETGHLKRERECVMCLTEEMSVVFLPCAHQVVCTNCNKLHEKQGMKDCPSCRTPIQQRICARFLYST